MNQSSHNGNYAPNTQAYYPNQQGYNQPNNDDNDKRKRKILISAIICLVVLLIVAIGFLCMGIYKRNAKQKQQAELIEKMRQDSIAERMRQDSLMLNFSAPDLTVFQAKGYVKEIIMTVSNEYTSSTFTFEFSTDGVLTGGKYAYEGGTTNIDIKKRNAAIRDFVIKYNSDEGYYDTETYSFVYNKDLNVSSITNTSESAYMGEDKTTYTFSQFDGMNLPAVASVKSGGYSHGMESKGSGTLKITYKDFDQAQNWISATWSGMIKYTTSYYYDEDTSTDTHHQNTNLTRVILYYDREEIFGMP